MALTKDQRKFLSQYLKVGTKEQKAATEVAYEAALKRKAAILETLSKIKANDYVKAQAGALQQKLTAADNQINTGKFTEANVALTNLELECKAVLEKGEAAKNVRDSAKEITQRLGGFKTNKSVADETGAIKKSLGELIQRSKDGDVLGASERLTLLKQECDSVDQIILEHKAKADECKTEFDKVVLSLQKLQKLPNVRKEQFGELVKRLQAARGLRDCERYAYALAALADIADLIKQAEITASMGPPQPGESQVKLSKKAQAEQERQGKIDAHTLEVALMEESIDSALGDEEISELLAAHRASVTQEAAVFRGYRWLDDVIEIKDDSLRETKLEEINGAVVAAKDRQRRLVDLLKKVPSSPTTSKAINDAWGIVLRMTNHIPEAFLAESNLEGRLATLTMNETEKEEARDLAMASLDEMVNDDGEPDPKGKMTRAEFETKMFKDVIEHGSLKSVDRTQFFFDDPIRSLTPEQSTKLTNQYAIILDRAYTMRDAGASADEVEASLKSVPPEFWPPAFIESLVAWRRVERELADERVQELFAKNKVGLLKTAKDCIDFIADNLSIVSDISEVSGDWMKLPEVAEYIKKYIEDVRGGWGLGDEYAEAMESCEFDALDPKKLAQIPEKVASSVKTLAESIASVKDLPGVPEASVFVTQVVPVLNCVASGIEMGLALKALGISIQRRVQTGLMIDKAELEYLSGRQRDGGAFVSALKNERGARKRQIANKSVVATTKVMAFSGDVATSTGMDMGAGQIVKITGKAIEYGNKIVFAGIDWGIANQVKKLIKRAQAGDPVARMEIMENSGLYAKMYICILAKDGHRLATTFIVQRGYTEKELENPAVSLKILREAMLNDADQRDETEVADNLGQALLEGATSEKLVRGVKNAGSFIAEKVAKLGKKIKDLPKDKNIPYNAQWPVPTFGPAALTLTTWNTTKNNAVKQAGLYDDSTSQIEKAFKLLEPLLKAADDALSAFDPKQAGPTEKKTLVTTVQKGMNQLLATHAALSDFTPLNNQGEFHEPMARCLIALESALSVRRNRLDQALVDKDVKDPAWKPSAVTFRSASWTLNWNSAVEELCLEIDDAGAGNAIQLYENALASEDLKDTAPKPKQRAARVVIRERLKTAALALKGLSGSAGEYPALLSWVDELITLCLTLSQENDRLLNGAEWKDGPPAGEPTLTVAAWTPYYNSAVTEGYAKAGDKKMSAALAKWTTEKNKFDQIPEPPLKMKQREVCVKALAEIAGAAEGLASANPDTHSKFAAYLAALRRSARTMVGTLDKEQANVTFTPVAGFTQAGWHGTLQAAIDAGAVAPNKAARKLLGNALKNYSDKLASMKSETNAKKKRKLAEEGSKELAKVELAISKTATAAGLDENAAMGTYLSGLQDLAKKQTELQAVLDAENIPETAFGKQTFTWENKTGWQKVKSAAIDAGVLPDLGKTRFGERLEAAASAYNRWKFAPSVEKNKTAALGALNGFISMGTSLKSKSKNANLNAYFDAAAQQSRLRLNEIKG